MFYFGLLLGLSADALEESHSADIALASEDQCSFMQLPHRLDAVVREPREAFEACAEVVPVKGSPKPMPAVGFGTCCREGAHGSAIIESAKIYLASGGRLIDTAHRYSNHRELGFAIRTSGLPREDIWVTDKVNPEKVRTRNDVVKAVDEALSELGLDYVDLMLLHWPDGAAPNVELWEGMLMVRRSGRALNVGVSNYDQAQIEELKNATGEAPAVNQIEYHPWVDQETKDLVKWLKEQEIAITAYNVLGNVAKAQADAITAVAMKYKTTNAQVMIRWVLDHGAAPLAGATSRPHIRSDLNCSVPPHLSEADSYFLENSPKPSNWQVW